MGGFLQGDEQSWQSWMHVVPVPLACCQNRAGLGCCDDGLVCQKTGLGTGSSGSETVCTDAGSEDTEELEIMRMGGPGLVS